jgi:hypothetical protein
MVIVTAEGRKGYGSIRFCCHSLILTMIASIASSGASPICPRLA